MEPRPVSRKAPRPSLGRSLHRKWEKDAAMSWLFVDLCTQKLGTNSHCVKDVSRQSAVALASPAWGVLCGLQGGGVRRERAGRPLEICGGNFASVAQSQRLNRHFAASQTSISSSDPRANSISALDGVGAQSLEIRIVKHSGAYHSLTMLCHRLMCP